MRTPDEILDDLDRVQSIVEATPEGDAWDVRALVWEVIEDMLDSLDRYKTWSFEGAAPEAVVTMCHGMLTDYVTNNYGDD